MARSGIFRTIILTISFALLSFASPMVTTTSYAGDDVVLLNVSADLSFVAIEAEAPAIEKLRAEAESGMPPLELPHAVNRLVKEADIRVALETYRRSRGIG